MNNDLIKKKARSGSNTANIYKSYNDNDDSDDN